MDFSPFIQPIGAALAIVTAFVSFGLLNWVRVTNSAHDATEIYEGLNKALKEQVSDLEDKLNRAVAKLEAVESQVVKLTDDIAFYEDIFHKALSEYFETHPDIPHGIRSGRKVKV